MLGFTFIIPVYNAEKTLERCLDSIRMQTISNFEVILVDDGSSDESLNICKQYRCLDHRYQVIHKKNGGPSSARNVGLDAAMGEWICFVDADDTIAENYLEEISKETLKGNADAIYMGYRKIGQIEEIYKPNVETDKKDAICVELSKKDLFGYTWIKCLKKEIIGNTRFDVTLDLFEDEVFTCQVMGNCEKISVINEALYNYYVLDGSLMGRTHNDYCLKCEKVYNAWKMMLRTNELKLEIMQNKANFFVKRCYYYAFERDIDIKGYFGNLKNTSFFRDHTYENVLDKYVEKNNFKKLFLEKLKYQMKNFAYSFIHRQ